MEPDRGGPGPGRVLWPIAITVIAVVAIFAVVGVYVFKSLRDIPGELVEGGREVLQDIRAIAQAFNQGTVTTSFISYATEVSGSNYLQFATLKQVEIFERTDSATTLWGQMDLPDLVVRATAPVQYTYYLDLDATWEFLLEDETVSVIAPQIRFNKPAIDASAIRYEVREDSLLRDEEEAQRNLKQGLTGMSYLRAKEHIQLVRELGRRKTQEFVENWLLQSFDDASSYRVEVVFADEVPSLEVEEALN